MSDEVITVKVEPPDEFDNKSSDVYQNGLHTDQHVHDGGEPSHSGTDKRNFTCLLCDLVFESRDDLRRHLKVAHTSKNYFTMPSPGLHHGRISDSLLSGFSSYVNYRYTCTVCGAKFKAFRSYLTHSMSHRGTGSLRSQFDDVRIASILNSGKQHLQDYIDSEDGLPSSFTCDECKTVFSQRDSYAMHMMMRAMNETCMSSMPEHHKIEPNDTEESADKVSDKASVSPQNLGSQQESSPSVFTKSLEDVTSKVDQDEYLKSVLDRVFVRDNVKFDRVNNVSKSGEEYKLCTFCGSSFEDQDSLAMHVMSDHAEQIIPSKRKSPRIHVPKPEIHWPTPTTLINSSLSCKICGQSFVSRDSLAMHVLAHTQDFSRGVSALNDLKRSQTFDSYLQPRKTTRPDESIDLTSTSRMDKVVEIKKETLYCAECNIKFYAESEYNWHNDNHHKKDITTEEPLCLAKSASDLKENNGSLDDNKHRVRRNSFSCDEHSRYKNLAPRRPLSTGNLTTSEHMNVDVKQERATDLSKKSPKHTVAPNVNALSTAEQRIIYSVFGKDLRLTPPAQSDTVDQSTAITEEKKQRTVKPQRLENKVRPQTSKSPLNLSYGHSRSVTPSYSGYPNGDKDGCSIPTTLPKDAAMCRFCEILFLNKAIYYLHMGLHNVNNPWQCNVCGKVCADAVDFAAHVIHM